MSPFTSGPWTISEPWSGFSSIKGGNGELVFGLAAGSAEEKRSDEECEANAHLISAAPDLLEALKALLQCAEIADCAPEDKESETDDAERLARAAIAKATGDAS